MKKLISLLITLLLFLTAILAMSSCGNSNATPSNNECRHQWAEADCAFPKTCRLCSKTEGEALGHLWVDATCTTPKTCSRCNKTEGTALGHSWVDATCQSPKICSICSAIDGLHLNEHNYEDGKCIYCNQSDPKEKEFESADIAYFYLTISHQLCTEIMDSIYGAWYFAIYESDDYYMFSSCLRAFCSEANLNQDDVKKSIDKVLQKAGITDIDDDWRCVAMQVPSYAVAIVVQVYTDYGTYDSIDVNLSNAKEALKSVTNNYADYTGYPTLKSYYSEISSYYEFCSSPTGSFNQLKTTIETYETNLRKYKNDLSFIFE